MPTTKQHREPVLYKTEDLARRCGELRAQLRYTLKEVAERLHASGYSDRVLSPQSIFHAESPDVGSKMNTLRVAIIEELAGVQLDGPVWIEKH